MNDINYGNATRTSEVKGDALLYPKLDANGIQIFDDSQCPNNLGKNPASKDVAQYLMDQKLVYPRNSTWAYHWCTNMRSSKDTISLLKGIRSGTIIEFKAGFRIWESDLAQAKTFVKGTMLAF